MNSTFDSIVVGAAVFLIIFFPRHTHPTPINSKSANDKVYLVLPNNSTKYV